jgi:outer membrane protein assembly factor BamB
MNRLHSSSRLIQIEGARKVSARKHLAEETAGGIMRRIRHRCLVGATLLLATAHVRSADYLAEGGDPQRTGWVRDEKIFNTTNVRGMKLLWKLKLDTPPREMHNLFPPLVVEKVATAQGVKQIAVVAGVSDTLFGIDVAAGTILWSKKFDSTYTPAPGGRGSGTLCPGGQTAVPVIGATSEPGKYTVYAVSWDGRLRQVNVADGTDAAPPEKFAPPNAKPYALNLHNGVIYTTAAQGCGGIPFSFLSFDLATRKASALLPQGGGLWGRRGPAVAPDGTAYQGTGDGPYLPEARNLGNAIVAVKIDENKQLQLKDWYAPPNANWLFKRDLDINVTPMVVDYRGRRFLIGTSKECRLWLLDRDALGGEDHRTALETKQRACNDHALYDAAGVWGAMAAWQDARGAQWVLLPFWGPVSAAFKAPIENGKPERGGVAAFKLELRAGKWQLTPAWTSRDIDMAEEVVVAGGVVFTYGSGEDTYQTRPDRAWNEPVPAPLPDMPGVSMQSVQRIAGSRHATIYALDGQTGKELWSSGDQIASWNHFSGITAVNGRVYLPTYDGILYCFGVK